MSEHQTVRLSLPQFKALSSSFTNAITEDTKFQAAQYLLEHKGLINEQYAKLIWNVEKIDEWERFYKYHFGLVLDLSNVVLHPFPLDLYQPTCVIVPAMPEQMKLDLLYRRCRDFFNMHFIGDEWYRYRDQEHRFGNKDDEVNALKFFCGFEPVTLRRRQGWNEGVWVDRWLELPHRYADKPDSWKFFPFMYEPSRCVSLVENLLLLIKHYTDTGGKEVPNHDKKTWCLGSKGPWYDMDTAPQPQGYYFPLLWWQGRNLVVECVKRFSHDENTGTRQTARTQ